MLVLTERNTWGPDMGEDLISAGTDLAQDHHTRWKDMLRSNSNVTRPEKPQWKAAVKVRSPSERSYAEGGSLRTNRLGWNRARSETRSTRSRSPSPGLFGSTAASRAKQREAIISRSRSSSAAQHGNNSLRRHRSVSPVRRPPARPLSSNSQVGRRADTSLNSIMKNTERSTSSQSTNSSYTGSITKSEMETNKSSVWVAPKENPLEFQYFRKNFLDFKDDYQYCYNSSEYNSQGRSLNIKNSKKKVSYADSKKFVSLGFRVL